MNTFTMGDVDIEVEEPTGTEYPGLKPGATVDKQAGIKNIGDNAAWVWLTVAIPEEIADVVTPVWNDDVVVDRVDTIKDVAGNSFRQYTVRVDKPLAVGESTGNILAKVAMSGIVDYVDGDYYKVENGQRTLIDYDLSNFDVVVTGYAIQTDGFANVEAAYEAYTAQWGEATLNTTTVKVEVGTKDDLAKALATDAQYIVVELTDDVTYDVTTNANGTAMGGASTEKITIIGNGHTLTFNHKHTENNIVDTKNDATLVLKDVLLTNSGNNTGTWNQHDIAFNCDVEMTNVTSDKALAFKADAKLTKVTINDANTIATYAIWIQPNG